MVFCSHCGKEVASTGTNFCPNCGQSLTGQVTPNYNPYKNPTTAALIAIIGGIFGFMGIGHIYAGKIGKGIIILVGGIILFAVGLLTLSFFFGFVAGIPLLIIYFVIWIWQIFDARATARKFNEHLKATGKEPW